MSAAKNIVSHRTIAPQRISSGRNASLLEPGRAPLLEERAQPVLAFLARPPPGGDLRGRLSGRVLPDELLGGAHRLRAALEQRLDHRVHGSVEILGHLVNEADAERGFDVEPLAGEEVPPRCARTDARGAQTGRSPPG